MKKHLVALLGLLAVPAWGAVPINFDTVVQWNSAVIERALDNVGLIRSSDAHEEVRLTGQRILRDLLKKSIFSLRTATQVCLDDCNMSDFLKNGRGASGKSCLAICESFAKELVKSSDVEAQIAENYAQRVRENGMCVLTSSNIPYTKGAEGCQRVCRAHAQRYKCELRNFGLRRVYDENAPEEFMSYDTLLGCDCNVQSEEEFSWYGEYHEYEYTPSYAECVATYNEKTCSD